MSAVAIHGALAIHPGALGDVRLAIPALRALRSTSGPVTLAAQGHIAALVATLGEADNAVDFERLRLDALFSDDGRAELPSAERVVSWFGARDADFTRRLQAQAPGAVVAPAVARGLAWEHLLRTSGVPDGDWRAPARVAPPLLAAGRAALRGAGWDGTRPVVVVQPGAGSVRKCWPADGFAAVLGDLAGDLGVTVVLHEGPADAAAVDALAARVPDVVRLRNPPLPALAGVLRLAALYLGNDSGVSHLAASIGAQAVVLFAAENLGWRPWAPVPDVLTVTVTRVEPADVTSVRAALRRRLG